MLLEGWSRGEEEDSQLRPDHGRLWYWAVVGIGVEDLIRTRVEAIIGSNLPHRRPVLVRMGDPKEGQAGHRIEQLHGHQPYQDLWELPSVRKMTAGHHFVCNFFDCCSVVVPPLRSSAPLLGLCCGYQLSTVKLELAKRMGSEEDV